MHTQIVVVTVLAVFLEFCGIPVNSSKGYSSISLSYKIELITKLQKA